LVERPLGHGDRGVGRDRCLQGLKGGRVRCQLRLGRGQRGHERGQLGGGADRVGLAAGDLCLRRRDRGPVRLHGLLRRPDGGAGGAAPDWEAPAPLLTPWSPRPALRSTTEVWSAPVSTLTAALAVPPTAPTLYLADWRLAVTGPAVAGTVSSPLLGPLAESMA